MSGWSACSAGGSWFSWRSCPSPCSMMWPAWLAERFLSMKKKSIGLRGLTLSALATALLSALPAWAVDPFTLRDIRVEGLQRVEAGTVFASLPFRIGDQYNDDKGSTAIRSLPCTLR
eukprot:Opistho-1_new@21821